MQYILTSTAVLIRAFARKHDRVEPTARNVVNLVRKLRRVNFESILILVWMDVRFIDPTVSARFVRTLQRLLGRHVWGNDPRIEIVRHEHGEIMCTILNEGIFQATLRGCQRSMIVSTEARSYVTLATLEKLSKALDRGALAAGVAIDEAADSVRAGGLMNTFDMIDNRAVMTVGGFDLRAAKHPENYPAQKFIQEAPGVFTSESGFEEICTLGRLVGLHGRVLTIVEPERRGRQEYVMPDYVVDPDERRRLDKKWHSKEVRKNKHLATLGLGPDYLKYGIREHIK